MMVEIFCGILSGGSYGPHVRKWKESHLVANLVSKHHRQQLWLYQGVSCWQGHETINKRFIFAIKCKSTSSEFRLNVTRP